MEWLDINIYLTKNDLSILLHVIIIHALSLILFLGHKCDVLNMTKLNSASAPLLNVVECCSFFILFKCLCDRPGPYSSQCGCGVRPQIGSWDLFVISAFWM